MAESQEKYIHDLENSKFIQQNILHHQLELHLFQHHNQQKGQQLPNQQQQFELQYSKYQHYQRKSAKFRET